MGTEEADAIMGVLLTEDGRADPYPYYAKLRELGPASSVWGTHVVVTGYAEANATLRNPAFGKWAPLAEFAQPVTAATLNWSILDANPPDHTRVRKLMSSVFTPRRTAGLAPAVAKATDMLLDAMADAGADGGAVDFMEEFAFRLPVSVICELLGVPEADRFRFRGLARDLTATMEPVSDPEALAAADAAAAQLYEYFVDLVRRRRAEPRDDLVSALTQEADDRDGRLSEQELISNLVLLLFAGFETTTNLFGNGLAVLFDRPRMAHALRGGAEPVADFVEEVLRYDSPVQLTSRLALTDGLELGGVPVPRDMEVLLLLGAANRDPARFGDPELFDPARPDNQPLSFGAGAHFCLGAALARLEAATAFPRLLERFPKLAPAGGAEPVRSDRLVLRGYLSLPVTVV